MVDSVLFNTGLGPVVASKLQVTPTGGTTGNLGDLINGGTVAQTISANTTIASGVTVTNSGTITGGAVNPATVTVGSNVVSTLANYGSITPAGSNQATAALIQAAITDMGTAASTTGAVCPAASTLFNVGPPLLLINSGTAAVHVYAHGADTIDNAAGSTGVSLTNGFGVQIVATGTAS